MSGEISDEKRQGYLDGFKAALEIAASVKVRAAPEIDPAIDLGVKAVTSVLDHQYEIYLQQEK